MVFFCPPYIFVPNGSKNKYYAKYPNPNKVLEYMAVKDKNSISSCRNCGKSPEVVGSDDADCQYMLRHKPFDQCYSTFMLASYQNSPKECASDWNKFNKIS